MQKIYSQRGFTIVELLIVVVVIAILAAVTIVAYNGISTRAKESSLKTELTNGVKQLQVFKIQNGAFPTDTSGIKKADTTTFTYTYDNATQTFCLSAVSSLLAGKTYRITEAGTVTEGNCAPTTMQAMTSGYCASMDTYTGSNPSALITLTDSRGGTTRSYEVGKLVDGKCWMLTNLKLGSTSATTLLTPSDTNIGSNFTLPQIGTTSSEDYDTPEAFGPVPGDTGAGTTNYGYLYNWSAATSGANRTSNPAGSGDAQFSICPLNWRLPTGGTTSSEFAQLDIGFGGTGSTAYNGEANIAKWQSSGPFKNTPSGLWWSGVFEYHGSEGVYWTRSVHDTSVNHAFAADIAANLAAPGANGAHRGMGLSVRCVL